MVLLPVITPSLKDSWSACITVGCRSDILPRNVQSNGKGAFNQIQNRFCYGLFFEKRYSRISSCYVGHAIFKVCSFEKQDIHSSLGFASKSLGRTAGVFFAWPLPHDHEWSSWPWSNYSYPLYFWHWNALVILLYLNISGTSPNIFVNANNCRVLFVYRSMLGSNARNARKCKVWIHGQSRTVFAA